jgi:hypothetical protein
MTSPSSTNSGNGRHDRAGSGRNSRPASEIALRVLYQRKAFRESTGMDEEHYPHGGGPAPRSRSEKEEGPEATPRLKLASTPHRTRANVDIGRAVIELKDR